MHISDALNELNGRTHQSRVCLRVCIGSNTRPTPRMNTRSSPVKFSKLVAKKPCQTR